MTQRLKLTEKLVGDLMKHSDAWPFLKPVTKREVCIHHLFIYEYCLIFVLNKGT